tara:strand:+ start:460 stop:900 length:441 start_codon:yes stop_codon:yes gene_type:complete
MKYTIREINNGVATIDFEDDAWAEVPMESYDTPDTFSSKVETYATKTYKAPSWAMPEATVEGETIERELDQQSEGGSWDGTSNIVINTDGTGFAGDTAVPIDALPWMVNRLEAYGPVSSQIEFIVENGLDAWIEEVKQIKAENPKE